MSKQHKVPFGSLVNGSAFSFDADGRVMVKVAVDKGAELVDGPATDSVVVGVAASRMVYLRKVLPRDECQKPVRWSNGCNLSVPAALRYLATHERPIGGQETYNSEHLYQLANEIERMAALKLYGAPPLPADTVKKFKFDTLVEHCKRQDEEIARMRAELNNLRIYTDGQAWHWQGDGQDHLGSLTCPVVINAEDLRELLRSAVAAVLPAAEAMPVDGRVSAALETDLCAVVVKSVLRLNDDGLWVNFELNGKHVGINLDHVAPAEFFCAEFRAKYAGAPVALTLGDDRTIARLAAEKAPEGATHCGPRMPELSPIFVRMVDGLITDVWVAGRAWNVTGYHYTYSADDQPSIYHRLIPLPCDGNHGGPRCADPECWIDDVVDAAFDAPIEAVPGLLDCSCLPPVGVFCEMQDAQGAWIKVEIFALHAGFAHGWDAGYKRSYFSDLPKEFRPLRTPEQIAAEERIKAAQEWLRGVEREYGVEVADQCENILMAAEAKRVAE